MAKHLPCHQNLDLAWCVTFPFAKLPCYVFFQPEIVPFQCALLFDFLEKDSKKSKVFWPQGDESVSNF